MIRKHHYKLLPLLILLIFMAAGCGTQNETAQQAIDNALAGVKNANQETIIKYFGEDIAPIDETLVDGEAEQAEQIQKMLYTKMVYTINSVTENESSATANVELTLVDLDLVIANIFQEMLGDLFANAFLPEDQQLTEAEISQMVFDKAIAALEDENVATKTCTVDFTMQQNDEKLWQIDPSPLRDAFSNSDDSALFGSTDDTASSDENVNDKLYEIREWLVSDIWNKGFCEIPFYLYDGKGSTGQTLDIEFTLSQLEKAMAKKADYDLYMSSLPIEYSDLSEIWVKLSGEIDNLYQQVTSTELIVGESYLDTGLYQQYFDAFDDAYFDLTK